MARKLQEPRRLYLLDWLLCPTLSLARRWSLYCRLSLSVAASWLAYRYHTVWYKSVRKDNTYLGCSNALFARSISKLILSLST